MGDGVTNALGTIYKTNRSATEGGLGRRQSITYPKGEFSRLLLPSSSVRASRLALEADPRLAYTGPVALVTLYVRLAAGIG